jgi:HSP20 family molecular chaperone IbpA
MPDLKIWCDQEFERLKSETDRLFDNFYKEFGLSRMPAGRMDISMQNEGDSLLLHLRMQGFSEMDIALDLSETHLTISCKREHKTPAASSVEVFTRKVPIPAGLAVEEAAALMHGDHLEIIIPRRKTAASARIALNIMKGRGKEHGG